MPSVRILIVDDHQAVRRGVRSLLSARVEWAICAEAVDGLDAVEKAKRLRPNMVLMDITMPRMGGVQATKIEQLKTVLPPGEITEDCGVYQGTKIASIDHNAIARTAGSRRTLT